MYYWIESCPEHKNLLIKPKSDEVENLIALSVPYNYRTRGFHLITSFRIDKELHGYILKEINGLVHFIPGSDIEFLTLSRTKSE